MLEVVVHHLDIARALGRPPQAAPAAGRIAADVLEGLLDDPRPRNLGRTRFLLTATGSIASDDPRMLVLR
ncbi:MAG: hypothetical protein ACR2MA_11535 [Egibacteraceae bacterium]